MPGLPRSPVATVPNEDGRANAAPPRPRLHRQEATVNDPLSTMLRDRVREDLRGAWKRFLKTEGMPDMPVPDAFLREFIPMVLEHRHRAVKARLSREEHDALFTLARNLDGAALLRRDTGEQQASDEFKLRARALRKLLEGGSA